MSAQRIARKRSSASKHALTRQERKALGAKSLDANYNHVEPDALDDATRWAQQADRIGNEGHGEALGGRQRAPRSSAVAAADTELTSQHISSKNTFNQSNGETEFPCTTSRLTSQSDNLITPRSWDEMISNDGGILIRGHVTETMGKSGARGASNHENIVGYRGQANQEECAVSHQDGTRDSAARRRLYAQDVTFHDVDCKGPISPLFHHQGSFELKEELITPRSWNEMVAEDCCDVNSLHKEPPLYKAGLGIDPLAESIKFSWPRDSREDMSKKAESTSITYEYKRNNSDSEPSTHESRRSNNDAEPSTHESRRSNNDAEPSTHESRRSNNDAEPSTHESRWSNNERTPSTHESKLNNNVSLPITYESSRNKSESTSNTHESIRDNNDFNSGTAEALPTVNVLSMSSRIDVHPEDAVAEMVESVDKPGSVQLPELGNKNPLHEVPPAVVDEPSSVARLGWNIRMIKRELMLMRQMDQQIFRHLLQNYEVIGQMFDHVTMVTPSPTPVSCPPSMTSPRSNPTSPEKRSSSACALREGDTDLLRIVREALAQTGALNIRDIITRLSPIRRRRSSEPSPMEYDELPPDFDVGLLDGDSSSFEDLLSISCPVFKHPPAPIRNKLT